MKNNLIIIVMGVVIIVLGLIFHLQGQGVVGPESSFMYSNPEWISIGQQIMIVGAILICISSALQIYKKINK